MARLDLHGFWKLASFGCLPLLASCASVTPPGEINDVYRDILDERHNHYQLKPGDSVVVELYDLEGDLNQRDIVVLPDGKSDMFFVEGQKLEGMTLLEVQELYRAKLKSQLRDSDTIEIRTQVRPAEERIHLVGEFFRPSSLPLTTKMTLQEAIAMAGGLRVTGDTDWALLRRSYLNPRHPDRFRIDLNDESEELFLLPGDQIILSRTWLATVVVYLQEYVFGIFGQNPLYYGATFAFAAI